MIVGHSMGGMLAARFATQYPDDDGTARPLQPDRPDRSAGLIGRGRAPTKLYKRDAWHDVSDRSRAA